jgi:hypothetical protein
VTHTRQSLLQIISAYERESKSWENRAEGIVKRYKDERGTADSQVRRYNVLWSNVETLKPFLYSATPKPVVTQRGDDSDPVGRVAAEILERSLVFTVAEDHFGSSMRNARDDYLLPGRGSGWVRYVPEFKPAEGQVSENDQPSDEEGIGDSEEIVAFETTVLDYVHWKDFGHELARTWEEVDVVWRRVGMNRVALTKRFGEELGKQIPLDMKTETATGKVAEDQPDKGVIYEMWIKSEQRAVWLSKSWQDLLDDMDDPLKLDHFFPCPKPAYATLTTDSLIPVPDFIEYQDQAHELDDLTGRIALITKSIKAVGVYDASVEALGQILNDGHDNKLIPVKNWAALSEKGGIQGAIELFPMKELAETLLGLYKARDEVKADLYEITGMSDIIRGNTAPEETATAQQIKSNFATKRLEERQREVERFARNAIDLIGNVIAVHFSQDTLIRMSGMKLMTQPMKQLAQQMMAMAKQLQQLQPQQDPNQPPNPQAQMQAQILQTHLGEMQKQAEVMLKAVNMRPEDVQEAMTKPTWEEVMALLRDRPRRRFMIDIETDSIVAPDDQLQQQQRTQFITSVTQFLESAGQIAQGDPTAVPMLGQLLLFGARGFRAGRDLMDTIETYIDQKTKAAEQPQPQKPDPAMAKVQSDAQLGAQKLQLQAQSDQAEQQAESQRHAAEMQQEAQLEVLKAHLAQQAQQQQAALQSHAQQQEAALSAMLEKWKAELQARTQIEVAEIGSQATLDAAQISAANQGSGDA